MRFASVTAALTIGFWQCCFGHESRLHQKITVVRDPNNQENVVFITWLDEHIDTYQCQIVTNPKQIRKVLRNYNNDNIHQPNIEEMQNILEECNFFSFKRRTREAAEDEGKQSNETTGHELSDSVANIFNNTIIYPGTKWCGAGDKAKSDDDLGEHRDTDSCCRAHDKCDDFLVAGETRHNLTNMTPYTRLNCKCDNAFYDCLEKINSVTSNTVAHLYFNILRSKCYAKVYPPSKKCKTYRSLLRITCKEYEPDTTKPLEYRFVKAKFYKKITIPDYLEKYFSLFL